jgi:hypothetical protein
MFHSLFLLILLPLGFVGCAWATNSIFDMYQKNLEGITTPNRLGTLLILSVTFGTYCYLLFKFFLRD